MRRGGGTHCQAFHYHLCTSAAWPLDGDKCVWNLKHLRNLHPWTIRKQTLIIRYEFHILWSHTVYTLSLTPAHECVMLDSYNESTVRRIEGQCDVWRLTAFDIFIKRSEWTAYTHTLLHFYRYGDHWHNTLPRPFFKPQASQRNAEPHNPDLILLWILKIKVLTFRLPCEEVRTGQNVRSSICNKYDHRHKSLPKLPRQKEA